MVNDVVFCMWSNGYYSRFTAGDLTFVYGYGIYLFGDLYWRLSCVREVVFYRCFVGALYGDNDYSLAVLWTARAVNGSDSTAPVLWLFTRSGVLVYVAWTFLAAVFCVCRCGFLSSMTRQGASRVAYRILLA